MKSNPMPYMKKWFLVINVGSTSVKTRLFDAGLQVAASVNADFGGGRGLVIDGVDIDGNVICQESAIAHTAEDALAAVLLQWRGLVEGGQLQLAAIGHRIVHGAAWFTRLTPLSDDVLYRLPQLDQYAPLHNPLNRLGVLMAAEVFPDVPQFAVFDTAFHRQIPEYAGNYALPKACSSGIDFYRYGFHGISCQHSLLAASQLLGQVPDELNLVILHLGGGASATAVRNGVSVDTSMGFSPTEGLMMATRCGDVDPMAAIALQKSGMSLADLENLLTHQSGLKGVCGDADMRSLLSKVEQADPLAVLALDMYCYRIKKYIGAYFAILGGLSALIFTGGIGANAATVRSRVIQGLGHLGLGLDNDANQQVAGQNQDISTRGGRSRILVVQAEEEREIARQIQAFLGY